MARDISDDNIQKLRQGLTVLADAVDTLSVRPAPVAAPISDRSLTGDKINGGTITQFASTGIRDDATRLTVLVNNDGIITDKIDVEILEGNTTVNGSLNVNGEVYAQRLHVAEVTEDIRQSRTSSLTFEQTEQDSIIGKGLHWTGNGHTKQFIYSADKFFSSENLNLHRGKQLEIDGQKVINHDSLGPTIQHSNLRHLGSVKNFQAVGDVSLDGMVFWNSDQERLGIRTDSPNGIVSIAGNNSEIILDVENDAGKIGTWTSNDLRIVTDDTTRINVEANGNVQFGTRGANTSVINMYGRLGIGVNNIDPLVSLQTSGPIKFENKKMAVGNMAPTQGTYSKGDVVWNSEPQAGQWVGWICITEGTPGVWKPFGQIGR